MISEADLAQLDEDGWLLVPDVLDREHIARITTELERYFPDGREYAAHPPRYDKLVMDRLFPFHGDALNLAFVHPNLLELVSRVLGTDDVVLTEATVRAKYTGTVEGGGKHHLEFAGKNSIAYPRDEGVYRQLPMLLYFSDVDVDTGPTYVVSRRRIDGHLQTPWGKGPDEAPELYDAEVALYPTAGSLLVLSTRTYHRGSPVTAPGGARFSAFVGYHASMCTWMETIGFRNNRASDQELTRFMEIATPRQREALGFPRVDHPFWTEEAIEGVQFRFPDMDMSPYREAVARRTAQPVGLG
jgi:hypothetical protein